MANDAITPATALGQPPIPRVLLTEREAADTCGLSPSALYRARRAGELAFVQFGASIRYRPQDLRLWAKSRRTRETPEGTVT